MTTESVIQPEPVVVTAKAVTTVTLKSPFNLKVQMSAGQVKTIPLRAGVNTIETWVTETKEWAFVRPLITATLVANSPLSPTRSSSLSGNADSAATTVSPAALAAQRLAEIKAAEARRTAASQAEGQAKVATGEASSSASGASATAIDAEHAASIAEINSGASAAAGEDKKTPTDAEMVADVAANAKRRADEQAAEVKAKLAAATIADKSK